MILPNKITSFNESVLSKLTPIMKELQRGERNIFKIFKLTHSNYEEINEYLYALDILFLLDVVEKIDGDKLYVKTN
ncbi:ABC-three component system middle component 7 [Acidaminobacter sp. JC074]|uniref:ABC-three component system middle component 7 n=1 Tax=Acidaminobacter sp. JC074 TaxID=2530199 RepID=UPI0034DD8130